MKLCVLMAALLAALISTAAVPRAGAHTPGANLTAVGTPTIDGTMTPGEWDGAGRLDFAATIPPNDGGGTTPATLFVMNDATNLYIGLRVARAGEPRGSFSAEFDNDHDGVFLEEGDDGFVANPGTFYTDFYRTTLPPCPSGVICGLLDTQGGGTSDGRSASVGSGGVIVYEVSKPLDSADDLHDFSLRSGQTVGFGASIQLWSLVSACNFGSQCVAVTNVPSFGGGDITVAAADSTPPVLSVPAGITADATGPFGAVVSYSSSATDAVDGPVPVTCSPRSGSTFPAGTTTVTCSATDLSGNSASASFQVRVKGAPEQLADLGRDVAGVGGGTSLADKVKQAQTAFAGGNLADTCSYLAAFVNEVGAQSGKSIPEGQATGLILRTQRIRLVLGGQCVSASLIVNGGAEAAAGGDGTSVVPVPGWTTGGNFTVVDYVLGEPGGWPGPNAPGPPSRGASFFSGGPANQSSSASQTTSLTGYAGQIDRGGVAYSLDGWLGGFDSQNDNAVLNVSFKGKNGASLGTATIGPVLAVDRGNERGFVHRDAIGLIPAGTRSVVFQLAMTRTDGVFNDGYADNLSFVITP